ncbi:MAG: ThiF family adenylyltransferase [bacterium]|nr:ThiF family adenylyltransferase [bacterium]
MQRKEDRAAMRKLFRAKAIRRVVDDYREEENELFAVQHPSLVYAAGFHVAMKKYREKLENKTPEFRRGRWVYFPWSSTLVHILTERGFLLVRTARNRNLITEKEQKRFYDATIGIGGLSVGSSVAFAIALQSGGGHIKLADMDMLALSNTNRVLSGVSELGERKVDMVARRIWEMNPYTRIEVFPDGLTRKNIGRFFRGLDIIVDELDDLAVKYLIREQARKHRIPVVMGADNGDNAVVDIERYDLGPGPRYFHGRLGDISYESLNSLDKFGIGRTIARHIGPETIAIRMQESLLEMGKTIVSWPQLGGAALINGAAVAYCVRKILTGDAIEGNRAVISLDEKLVPNYSSKTERAKRARAANDFKRIFKL